MKVLLAEDSRSNQMIIRGYVESAGHQVITVDNGQKAIEAFISEDPDVIILDVIMPIKGGIEAALEIRRLSENEDDWVPIIFLSGMTSAKDIARGIDAGGDDYLQKPVSAIVLNAKLKAMQRIAKMRHKLHRVNDELKLISERDALTGISNRRHFDEVLQEELKLATLNRTSLSLVLADIDFFKPYNDNYGHQAGDDCLKAVSQAMASWVTRPRDLCARYGGEEFVVILPETELEAAVAIAEQIRSQLETLALPHEHSAIAKHITLSCGVSVIKPEKGEDMAALVQSLIERADTSLYRAKERGRNQVVASNNPKD